MRLFTVVKKKLKFITIIFIFLIIITSFRLLWFHNSFHSEQPLVKDGVIDFSTSKFSDHSIFLLNGNWAFYPDSLLTPGDLKKMKFTKKEQFVPIIEKRNKRGEKFGTYELTIYVPDKNIQYALKIRQIQSPFKLYSNGKLIKQESLLGRDINNSIGVPSIASVSPNEKGVIHLLIAYKMTSESYKSGIQKAIQFGTEGAIRSNHYFILTMQLVVALFIAFHGLYATILFLLKPKMKAALFFSIACFFSTLSVLISDDRFLATWISLNYQLTVKFAYLSYTGLSVFFLLFFRELFPLKKLNWPINFYIILCAVYSLFVLISPAPTIREWSLLLFVVLITSFTIIPILIIRVIVIGEKGSLFLLLAAISLVSSILWSTLRAHVDLMPYEKAITFDPDFYGLDLIMACLLFSIYCVIRFFRTSDENVLLVDQLQKEHVTKDQFLANTSHELRNPLHVMVNIAQGILMKEEENLTMESKNHLNLLTTVGRRMSYLLNDLIDITKIKQQEISLNKEPISLHNIIETVVEMQKIMANEKPLSIKVEIPDKFHPVFADENRLIQILFNLLHNAVKFTDEGEIKISVRKRGNYAVVSIKDNGIGINREDQSRIFLPYEQGEMSDYNESGGIGLGLSICKQLVEMHGGDLSVRSTVGKGATFSFTLPLSMQRAKGAVKSSPIINETIKVNVAIENLDKPKIDRPKIIIVDDDPVNIMVLKSILFEYDLTTVTSGQAVLSLLDKQWDLIISDVMMPNMSGYVLTKQIRQYYSVSELPVLLLTARNQPQDIYTGFLSGANDYVVKPVDATELRARVQVLIGLKQSINEQVRLEAAWLQAQIKPHFLFNTLNTILMLIEIDPEQTKELLEAFCNYLQMSYSFNNINQTILINDELDLVRSYVFIMNKRFKGRFKVVYKVDDGLEGIFIPPLTIQPLVENAINHGFLNGSREGEIVISIAYFGDKVIVKVEDNGIGMEKEVLDSLFIHSQEKRKGVGIVNINKRLNQMYGNGLRVESLPNRGTMFSFQITI